MKRLMTVIMLLGGVWLLSPVHAGAADILKVDCSGERATSAVCSDETGANPITGDNGLLLKIADIIAYIAGAAAVIIIVVSGINFITSGGNPENAKKARNGVLYALIGLAVIVVARALIVFVISKL